VSSQAKGLRHHTQNQMAARMEFLVDQIEQAGRDGKDKAELEQIMFVNGIASPRLTRSYLSYLSSWGRIRKEGTRYFGIEFREEKETPQSEDLTDTHTHIPTHESLN